VKPAYFAGYMDSLTVLKMFVMGVLNLYKLTACDQGNQYNNTQCNSKTGKLQHKLKLINAERR
jgi:hypothetical protein